MGRRTVKNRRSLGIRGSTKALDEPDGEDWRCDRAPWKDPKRNQRYLRKGQGRPASPGTKKRREADGQPVGELFFPAPSRPASCFRSASRSGTTAGQTAGRTGGQETGKPARGQRQNRTARTGSAAGQRGRSPLSAEPGQEWKRREPALGAAPRPGPIKKRNAVPERNRGIVRLKMPDKVMK